VTLGVVRLHLFLVPRVHPVSDHHRKEALYARLHLFHVCGFLLEPILQIGELADLGRKLRAEVFSRLVDPRVVFKGALGKADLPLSLKVASGQLGLQALAGGDGRDRVVIPEAEDLLPEHFWRFVIKFLAMEDVLDDLLGQSFAI